MVLRLRTVVIAVRWRRLTRGGTADARGGVPAFGDRAEPGRGFEVFFLLIPFLPIV